MAQWEVGGQLFTAYLVFSVLMKLLEQYLEFRQYGRNCETQVPAELKTLGIEVEENDFLQTQAYQRDKRIFGIIRDLVMFVWNVFSLFYVLPALWDYAATIFPDSEYKCTLLWFFLQSWADKPLGIPFSLYSHFVVEEKHGFNKMTIGLFVMDLAKSELLSYVFGGLIIPALIWIVSKTGNSFYLYLWGFVQFLIFAFMWIYPSFIQPLFNKFETLHDEELKKKIELLAEQHKFPLTKLFQVDGSKRSSHSNAYFFGFWKNKRIVLYDTLLHLSHGDILAILCHELGHWKFNHINFNLVISSAHIFGLFYLFGLCMFSGESSQAIVRQFGYGESQAIMVKLFIFTLMFEPVEQVMQRLMMTLSRTFEFQADGFALENKMGNELMNGLKMIHKENRGDLNPDPWYAWYHHSHPTLVERCRAIHEQTKTTTKKSE